MIRSRSIRLREARADARSLIRQLVLELPVCVWKWLRIEFAVWWMLKKP
jgi:hypothetical protein